MPTYVALLRGINLGANRRVAMADLRSWLAELGYEDVRTLLQSGNAVFRTPKRPATVQRELEARLAEHAGFTIDCVVRTADELRTVVEADPLGSIADDGSRYMVMFLGAEPKPPDFAPDAFAPELFHVGGREVYFWVPDGVRNSKVLAAFPAGKGDVATVRNWNTVTKLLAMTES
ncbi:DUF1697 domain-containing protein [Actinophytocola sp.]|uniref:DUF1697 domain-containing protein n=1 Tax=Actinophytocola sp. TaxID=1872138 RepID=UPI003D6B6E56